ncbi:MAG: PHP-associated domain-containing protein [Chloroflexota bacterium]
MASRTGQGRGTPASQVTPAPAAQSPAEATRRDVDLHVHTVTSACGFTTHRRVLDLARAAGRRVVAVTDHDSAAGAVAVRDLAARTGDDLLVLVGMELSTSDFGHVIVFGRGVEAEWGWQRHTPFPRHIPEHWVAIQAHPYRGKVLPRNGAVDVEALPPLPERIDAVEVWNGGDLIKKTPQLRSDLDALSWAYARREGKTPVASSDGHRPIWVHSFFTRFARPIGSVDDAVDQLRSGHVTPHAQEQEHIDWCIAGWRRREVVEWHAAGKDWRALAAEAGYLPDDAERYVARFQQVQALHARGATLAQIGDEAGLSPILVADYLAILEEEQHSAAKRRAKAAATV